MAGAGPGADGATPRRRAAVACAAIYLDAGRGDEYFLDLGAQAFSDELDTLGVEHTLELFDGRHGGIGYRYPRCDPANWWSRSR